MTYLTTSDLDRAIKESRRTPEAEAQIAAAREPPSDMEVAIQQVDEQEREMQEQTRRWAGARKGLNDEQRAALDTREAIEKQQRDRVDSLASSADRTTDWIGETRAMTARMGALQSERRILTTNHPEVTDPAERERLGLEPLSFEVKGCATPGCGFQAGHEAQHSCGRPPDRDPAEEAARRLRDAAPAGPDTVFAIGEPKEPSIVLAGEDVDIFDTFGRACAALENHAEAGHKLNADYRAALEQVSRMAARRNRGR